MNGRGDSIAALHWTWYIYAGGETWKKTGLEAEQRREMEVRSVNDMNDLTWKSRNEHLERKACRITYHVEIDALLACDCTEYTSFVGPPV